MDHLYVFFGEVSIKVFCPFFNWIICLLGLGYVSVLYILEINPISDVLLANIFSHTVGSLFIMFMVSFENSQILTAFKLRSVLLVLQEKLEATFT